MTSMTCYIDPTQRSPSSKSFKEISKRDAPHGIGTRQVSLHHHSPSILLLAIVMLAFYFAFVTTSNQPILTSPLGSV